MDKNTLNKIAKYAIKNGGISEAEMSYHFNSTGISVEEIMRELANKHIIERIPEGYFSEGVLSRHVIPATVSIKDLKHMGINIDDIDFSKEDVLELKSNFLNKNNVHGLIFSNEASIITDGEQYLPFWYLKINPIDNDLMRFFVEGAKTGDEVVCPPFVYAYNMMPTETYDLETEKITMVFQRKEEEEGYWGVNGDVHPSADAKPFETLFKNRVVSIEDPSIVPVGIDNDTQNPNYDCADYDAI